MSSEAKTPIEVIESVETSVHKIEIFKPKRKFNQPRGAQYLKKGDTLQLMAGGIEVTIHNSMDQHCFVRVS